MVLAFFFLFFLSVRSLRAGRVYMSVCVHMYMQVHIHVCGGGQRLTFDIFLNTFFFF